MGAPPSMEMNRRAGPEVPLYLAIDSLVVEGVQYYEKPAAKDGMHVQYYRNDTEYIDCKWYTLFHCACIKTISNSPFFSILLHFIVGQSLLYCWSLLYSISFRPKKTSVLLQLLLLQTSRRNASQYSFEFRFRASTCCVCFTFVWLVLTRSASF